MQKRRKIPNPPHDTPATRKLRLQQRLQELSEKGEQELAALMQSVEKARSTLRSNKP